MSPFLKHAAEIFETAQGGYGGCHLSILVGRTGGIHIISSCDWELERLREHYGAKAAYRVIRRYGEVCLEARSAGQTCVLKAEDYKPQPRQVLPEMARYEVFAWDNAGGGQRPPA